MVLEYFSWARAKKNKEDLEKTNPQNPVLKDEDEEFLQRIASKDAPSAPLPPSIIADDGNESNEQSAELSKAAEAAGTVALPSTPPVESAPQETEEETSAKQEAGPATEEKGDSDTQPPTGTKDNTKKQESTDKKEDSESQPSTETKDESKPQTSTESQGGKEEQPRQAKEAEQADASEQTKQPTTEEGTEDATAEPGKDGKEGLSGQTDGTKSPQTKRTWGSYVPSIPSVSWKSSSKEKKQPADGPPQEAQGNKQSEAGVKGQAQEEQPQEKVDEKVSDGIPKGIRITEDVKLDQPKDAQDEQNSEEEKEVSVLLDRLNLSSINNRVFSFSKKSQHIYEEFTVILKDMINGAPTAYEDMEKLLKENEGHLNELFGNMPPFVQTLVKSLPAKFGSTLGPEIMAAASDKPGNDLKSKLSAAGTSSSPNIPTGRTQKKKRNVPTTEALAKQKGAVASMLSNIVNFLKLRFPILLSTTNVVMSLAVFILLLVFWYCHKRGKETRLLKAAETDEATSSEASEGEDSEFLEKMEQERKGNGEEVAAEDETTEKTGEDDTENVEEDDTEEPGEEDAKETEEDDVEKEEEVNATSTSTKDVGSALKQQSPAEIPVPEAKS